VIKLPRNQAVVPIAVGIPYHQLLGIVNIKPNVRFGAKWNSSKSEAQWLNIDVSSTCIHKLDVDLFLVVRSIDFPPDVELRIFLCAGLLPFNVP
jgi:hypothetical protein